MDHNIPTPSIVVDNNKEIEIRVKNFREKKLLSLAKTQELVDVLLISDGENPFPIKAGDEIRLSSSSRLIKFIEFEKNYFFRSLQEKFSFE